MRKAKIVLLQLFVLFIIAGCATKEEKTVEPAAGGTKSNIEQSYETAASDVSETSDSGDGTGRDDTAASSEDITQPTEDIQPPELLYQGHASLRIVTEAGMVIYIDPYAGEGYDLPADLILITHAHYDHNDTDRIANRNEDCLVITQTEALQNGTHNTFTCGDVTVEAVEAGYNALHDVTQCVGYILTFANGVQLYVTGDTGTTPQMETLASRNIDYAFFCCDGIYNMDTTEASACAGAVSAKHSIPYHMIAADGGLFDRSVAETFQAKGRIILEPGNVFMLE